jgi:glycosyltransferase involved in cell wall biosynthesis
MAGIRHLKLSVVMAVRDGEPYVRDAIESVLSQSVADFEFLIVDDGSTDGTPATLSEYQRRDARITVFRNDSSQGPYPSANRALTHARGRVIARHDADDLSPPDRFAIQLDALDSATDTSLVTGAVELFGRGPSCTSCPPSWQPRLEWELLFSNAVGAGAHVMFPRVIGGAPVLFPARHRYAEDYGLWCRLSGLGRVVSPTQVIYRYRRHASSITSLKKGEQDECFASIRYDYQTRYLTPEVPREIVADASRFWNQDGGRPLDTRLADINSVIGDLRTTFATYVERRYGISDKVALDAELDRALSDRLAYWLYRSIRLRDARACRDLLSIARRRKEVVAVARRTLAEAVGARVRKHPCEDPGVDSHSRLQ